MREFKKFENNTIVSFEALRQSGNYDPKILDAVEKGDLAVLNQLLETDKKNPNFMEPLLYAVFNATKSYDVFTFFHKNLQADRKYGFEIVKYQPELIQNTPLAKDWDFIIISSISNPEVIRYMDDSLKKDPEFIRALCENSEYGNYAIIGAVYDYCVVPDDVRDRVREDQNKVLTAAAIGTGVIIFSELTDEQRDDYGFMRALTANNEEAIDYVVDNIDKFGTEGIKAARESSKDFTIADCKNLIEEMAEGDDKKYATVLKKLDERGLDDPAVVRWVTAVAVQRDDISPDILKKVFNYSVLSAERLKRQMSVDGKMQLSVENMQELITPHILRQYFEKLKAQGIQVDPEMLQKINEYESFYGEYQKQYDENREEIVVDYLTRQGKTDAVEKIKKARAITLGGIKKQAEGATLEDVNKSTAETRDGILEQSRTTSENKGKKDPNELIM